MSSLSKYLRLRRLVDVLYDVQDVRIRTANRLRQMPKRTAALYVKPLKLLEADLTKEIERILQTEPIYFNFLKYVKGIGPRISGCIISETMIRFVKIPKKEYDEAKKRLDSQGNSEAPKTSASHFNDEAHDKIASQNVSESHYKCASQGHVENQRSNASQGENEAHYKQAFTREQLELAQKTKGGDYLIPTLRGIAAFPTVSKYWAWWGLHVVDGHAPKRRRGSRINWSPKMRVLAWKIGKQFVMHGDRYRDIYLEYKRRLQRERPTPQDCPRYEECKATLKKREKPPCKGHIENMSRRYAVKMFVSHLWEKWRRLEGLPVRDPYAIDRLGHSTKVEP